MTLVSLLATLVLVLQGQTPTQSPASAIEGLVAKSGSDEGLAQSQITLVRTAWEDLEPNAYYDPDVLMRYESQGRAVVVREAGKVQVELNPTRN